MDYIDMKSEYQGTMRVCICEECNCMNLNDFKKIAGKLKIIVYEKREDGDYYEVNFTNNPIT